MRIAIILLAAVLGYAAGYLQFADAADQAVQHDRNARTRAPAARDVDAKGDPLGDPPLDAGAGPQTAAWPIDALAVPARPTGAATIRGVVLDEHQSPVPGARVQLEHQRAFQDALNTGPRREQDIEDLARAFVVRELYSRGAVQEVWTDAEGRFAFPGLAEEGYLLSASREGYDIRMTQPTTRAFAPVTAPSEVTFRAEVELGLPLRFEHADGRVPETMPLAVTHEGPRSKGRFSLRWTAARPTLPLVVGTWNFGPTPEAEDTFEPFTVHVVAGKPLEPRTVPLLARCGIAGRVLPAKEGLQEEGVMEIYYLRDEARELTAEDIRFETPSVHAHAHDGWRFRIMDIEPGTYFLCGKSWNLNKFGPPQWVTVAPRGVVDVAVERPTFDEGELLTVTLRGPDDEAVTDARFLVAWRIGGSGSSEGREGLLGSEPGVFLLPLPKDLIGLEGATATMAVISEIYGQVEVAFDHLNPQPLLVQFQRQARLIVRPTGALRREQSQGLHIGVQKLGQDGIDARGATLPLTGSPDALSFENLAPGEYRVSLGHSSEPDAPGGADWSLELVRVRVEAGQERTVAVSLPAMGTLTMLVPKRDSGMFLTLTGGASGVERSVQAIARADESGRAIFGALPDGHYMVSATDHGFGMKVRVSGPTEVQFQPAAARGLLVTIEGADGALAQAGFEDGDVIVNVKGKELKDSRDSMAMAMMRLMGSRECPVIVERAGSRIEITIDGRQIQRSARRGHGIGGDVNPVF